MTLETMDLILTGAGIVGSTVGITKFMLNSVVRSIRQHCADQKMLCDKWHHDGKSDREELWRRVNTHSHKGFVNEQNGKVTL